MRAADYDAVHLREEDLIRLPDPEIVAKAARERRIVLTFDLDFGDILAAARSEAPSVIIFRLRNQTPHAVNPRLFRVICDCEEELASGVIIIVEDAGYRVRRLPFDPEGAFLRVGPATNGVGRVPYIASKTVADFRGVIRGGTLVADPAIRQTHAVS